MMHGERLIEKNQLSTRRFRNQEFHEPRLGTMCQEKALSQ